MKLRNALRTLLNDRMLALSFLVIAATASAAPVLADSATQTTTSGATTASPATGAAGATPAAPATPGAGTTTSTGSTSASSNQLTDSNPGTPWTIRQNYFLRFPAAKEMGPSPGGNDIIKNKQSMGPANVTLGTPNNPLYTWPINVPTAPAQFASYRDRAILQDLVPTTGRGNDATEQLAGRLNDNRTLENMYDPERTMWASSSVAGMQATSAANGAANMTVNQAQSAIDFTASYLTNFTAEANNQWQALRNQLFIPMAVLLLLPGAVLAQVKAIVSQGNPVLGDVNPFEGILRSIVAIFLIPGTFLVINYGIDVANSITFTIADEYQRIFGTNMYQDANCAMQRAFPVNPDSANDNAIMASETPQPPPTNTPFSQYEALTLNLREYDPCAGLNKTLTADERARDAKKIGRMATNFANVGLSGMWNVMCAFQMAFLYYLWCMGPIAAALWVWPIGKLRSALPSWIEGVITLCFWSLFWNTVVCLMACFRGVGDSGTVIMSALTFLANIAVKYAFDFTGLISQGAATGVQQGISQMMQGAASAAGGGGSGGGAGGSQAAGAAGGSAGAGTAGGAGRTAGSPGAGLQAALSSATSQNQHSGLMGGAASTHGGSSLAPPMPSAASGTAGHGGAAGASSANARPDFGAPPLAAGSMNGGYTGTGGIHTASMPSPGGAAPGAAGASGAASLSSHNAAFTSNGSGGLQLNQQALNSMFGQHGSPGQQQQLTAAMQQLQQNHNANGLQSLAQNNMQQMMQGHGLDVGSQQALQAMSTQGFSMNSSDTAALASYLHGGNGITFDPQTGTAMNSFTHQPITMGAGLSQVQGGQEGMYLGANPSMASQAAVEGASNVSYASLANGSGNMFSAVEPAPTQGLSGLAANSGVSGPMQFADASGHQYSFTDNGQPIGTPPNVPVMAMNAQGEPVASYSPSTHEWSAPNTNGSVVMDSGTGQWHAASNGAPLTYDAGQWYGQGTNGSAIYNSESGTLASTTTGVGMNYEASTGQYYAQGTNNEVAYNSHSQQYETASSHAPVQYNDASHQWYASGTGDQVAFNTSSNSFEVASQSGHGGQAMSYDASSGNYHSSNNQVTYDSASHQFQATGSGAPLQHDSTGTQWAAAGSGGSLHYDGGGNYSTHSGAQVSYDQGQYYANNTHNAISYDPGSQSFHSQGGAPVQYENGHYYAGGTNHQVQFDGSHWVGSTASGGHTAYSYDSGSHTWTPQSHDAAQYHVASHSHESPTQHFQNDPYAYGGGGGGGGGGYGGYDPSLNPNQGVSAYNDPGYNASVYNDPGFNASQYNDSGYGASGYNASGYSDPAYGAGYQQDSGYNPGYQQDPGYAAPASQDPGSYIDPNMLASFNQPAEGPIPGITDNAVYPDPNAIAGEAGLYMQSADPYAGYYETGAGGGGGGEQHHHEHYSAPEPEHHSQHASESYESHSGGESHSAYHGSESAPPQAPPPQSAYSPAPPARGFNSIIPPIQGRGKAAPPPQQGGRPPTQQRPASPDHPESPQNKSGAMEMGAKQGGYKDQSKKKEEHRKLAEDSWAEYQATQNQDEEDDNPTGNA